MMPHREYLFHCWLDPENRTKCHFPLFPKPLGEGGGGSVIQCPFPLFQTIGRAFGSVRFNAYERGDYRDA